MNTGTERSWSRTFMLAAYAMLAIALVIAGSLGATRYLSVDETSGETHPETYRTPEAQAGPASSPSALPSARSAATRALSRFGRSVWTRDAAVSPSGLLAVGYDDSPDTHLWDLTDPAEPVELGIAHVGKPTRWDDEGKTWVTAITIRPDSREMTVSYDGGYVRVWDISEPKRPRLRYELPHYSMYVPQVAYDPSGNLLATSGYDDKVHLWTAGAARPESVAVLGTDTSDVMDVTFSPDGRRLLAQSYEKTTLWDVSVPTAARVLTNLPDAESSVFVSDFVVATQSVAEKWARGTITLWDVRNPAAPVPLSTLGGGYNEIFVDPKTHVLSVDAPPAGTSSLELWDVSDPAHPSGLRTLRGVARWGGLVFTADGRHVIDLPYDDGPRAGIWAL